MTTIKVHGAYSIMNNMLRTMQITGMILTTIMQNTSSMIKVLLFESSACYNLV